MKTTSLLRSNSVINLPFFTLQNSHFPFYLFRMFYHLYCITSIWFVAVYFFTKWKLDWSKSLCFWFTWGGVYVCVYLSVWHIINSKMFLQCSFESKTHFFFNVKRLLFDSIYFWETSKFIQLYLTMCFCVFANPP